MRKCSLALLVSVALMALTASLVTAAVEVITPANETENVTFTATVSEQCNIAAIPAAIGFAVTDHTAATNSGAQTVTLNNIVLLDTKKLKISIKSNAASFTKPDANGLVTYDDGDVTWNNGGGWTNGTGATGTLDTNYTEVVTSDANATSLSTAGLVFTLAAKDTIDRAGAFTLSATWKIEGNI